MDGKGIGQITATACMIVWCMLLWPKSTSCYFHEQVALLICGTLQHTSTQIFHIFQIYVHCTVPESLYLTFGDCWNGIITCLYPSCQSSEGTLKNKIKHWWVVASCSFVCSALLWDTALGLSVNLSVASHACMQLENTKVLESPKRMPIAYVLTRILKLRSKVKVTRPLKVKAQPRILMKFNIVHEKYYFYI